MPDDLGHIARLQQHGGKRVKGEQGDEVALRHRGNSRAYILARLQRDNRLDLLRGVLDGTISAFAASVEMSYTRRPPVNGRGSENMARARDWKLYRLLNPRSGREGSGRQIKEHPRRRNCGGVQP
jgi:hypothetical protein